MEDDEESVEIDRQARIMELAQQQQMALNRLDAVMQNQQNLRHNYFLRSRGRDADGEPLQQVRGGQEPDNQRVGNRVPNNALGTEEEADQQAFLAAQTQTQTNQTHHHVHRQVGICSITHLYFTLSALLAFLAVVTSPSNVLFASIRVGVNPVGAKVTANTMEVKAVHNAADAVREKNRRSEGSGTASIDGRGNLVDTTAKTGGWEAVVTHSKGKHPPLMGSSTKKNNSQKPPPPSYSPSSWTGTMLQFTEEVRNHVAEQYSVLMHMATNQPLPSAKTTAITRTDSKELAHPSRWALPWEWMKQKLEKESIKQPDAKDKELKTILRGTVSNIKLHSILSPVLRAIGPSLIQSFMSTDEGNSAAEAPRTATQTKPREGEKSQHSPLLAAADKIFTSTPRLLAIGNLLLAVTFLIHSAVADVFLGPVNTPDAAGNDPPNLRMGAAARTRFREDEVTRRRRTGRERFGGFLLFKLLLISAVLEPDSVDLFILLSWYTLLSFLRSLCHLAGATAAHASQRGEPPGQGALRLLILVLVCDACAASGCVALLHSTGWNMLLLLTCDCVLLGIDAITHIVRHFEATTEEAHRVQISLLEERQLELHAQRRQRSGSRSRSDVNESSELPSDNDPGLHGEEREPEVEDDGLVLEDELRQVDRAVGLGEAAHISRNGRFETTIFSLEMLALSLTIAHFIHIWALHGTSFGLVDGVLALHLHSTICLIGKKIAERQTAQRVSREINRTFPSANDIDIRKAAAAGDCCCICLNSMLVGGVKKVSCGHLFHTNCLREVVERERSFAAAKCPLCRASLVTGRHDAPPRELRRNDGNNDTNGVGAAEATGREARPAAQVINEQSLLRFSTENLLPAWVPFPAFAFEVVRRETPAAAEPNPNPEGSSWQRFFRRGGQMQEGADANNAGNNEATGVQGQPQEQPGDEAEEQQQRQQGEASFWRRLLILLGAIPMSPEEEVMALEQLVDMFPQYDRRDLLRELRARRSAEAVAESIILGIFSGVPRVDFE